MEEKLAELRGIVRDYVRMCNIKRASMIEMGQLLTPSAGQSSNLHKEEIWGEDPVHLTTKGYGMAAACLESLIYEKRGEEREAEEKGSQGPSKKPWYDAAENRPAWVKGSVAQAVGLSSSPGEAVSSQEVVEEDLATGRWLTETTGVPTRMDPDLAITEAGEVTGGEASEPQGGCTVRCSDFEM